MLYAGDNFVVSRPLTAKLIPPPRQWDDNILLQRPRTSTGDNSSRGFSTRYERALNSATEATSRRDESQGIGYSNMQSNIPNWRDDGPAAHRFAQDKTEDFYSYPDSPDLDANLEVYLLKNHQRRPAPNRFGKKEYDDAFGGFDGEDVAISSGDELGDELEHIDLHDELGTAPESDNSDIELNDPTNQTSYHETSFTPRPPPSSRGRSSKPSSQAGRTMFASSPLNRGMIDKVWTVARPPTALATESDSRLEIKGCPISKFNGKFKLTGSKINGAPYYKSEHRSVKGSRFYIYRTLQRQWALCMTERAMRNGQASFRTVTSSWRLMLPFGSWERYGSEYRKELIKHCGRWHKCTGMELVGVAEKKKRKSDNQRVDFSHPGMTSGNSGQRSLRERPPSTPCNRVTSSDCMRDRPWTSPRTNFIPSETLEKESLTWEGALFIALENDDAEAARVALKRPGADPNEQVIDDGRIKRGFFSFGKNGYRYNGKYERRNPLDYLTPKRESGISAFHFLGMRVVHNDTILDLAHRNGKSAEFRQVIREANGHARNMTTAEVVDLNQLGGKESYPELFLEYDPCSLFSKELETIYRKAKELEITDDAAIRVMYDNLTSGLFVEDHFISMWQARIRKKNANIKLMQASKQSKRLRSVVHSCIQNQRRPPKTKASKINGMAYQLSPEEKQLQKEFQSIAGKDKKTIAQHQLFHLFQEYEKSTESFLNKHKTDARYTKIFGGEGGMPSGLTMSDLQAVFKEVDMDGDGIISLNEYKEIVGVVTKLHQGESALQSGVRRSALQGKVHTEHHFATGGKDTGLNVVGDERTRRGGPLGTCRGAQ